MSENNKNQMKTSSENPIHIRRCHICSHVNEGLQSQNEQCQNCGKYFAPFVFFDEHFSMGLDDLRQNSFSCYQEKPTENEWQHPLKKQYPPLWGLSFYWS